MAFVPVRGLTLRVQGLTLVHLELYQARLAVDPVINTWKRQMVFYQRIAMC